MAGIIGKKIGMTSVFDENGNNIPVTIIQAGPCVVTQLKTVENDGYKAVQLAFGDRKEKHTTAALMGHFKKAKTTPRKHLVEFKSDYDQTLKVGDSIKADMFSVGEWCDVGGYSKGKGFQGVVKRHGFAGVGDATHGQHNRLRAPGSVGAASYPARVFKGMKMAGRTGGTKVKVTNLQVVKVMPEENIILLKGAVPGAKGGMLMIRK